MPPLSGLFLILACVPAAPIEPRYPEAIEVFHATFDVAQDRDYDGWPDGWRRRQGPGYPHFVRIGIEEANQPAPGRCLAIVLDGGAGAALSPAFPAAPLHDYVVDGLIRTEGLVHDRAWFSLTLLDDQGQVLETFRSPGVQHTNGWQRVRLGPVSAQGDRIRHAVLGVHLEPGEQADLRGRAEFADIWVGRLPRMTLACTRPLRLFTDPREITAVCRASGLPARGTTVAFELLDPFGNRLAATDARFVLEPPESEAAGASADLASTPPARTAGVLGQQPLQGYVGKVAWNPPVPGPGLYRIAAAMPAESGRVHRREITLCVLARATGPAEGEFGWNVDPVASALPQDRLVELLAQAGIGWVKCPLWLSPKASPADVNQTAAFVEALRTQGIEVIGLLDRPPDEVRAKLDPSRPAAAADVFSLPREVWQPSLEFTLTRLGPWIRRWQVGGDRDTSFVGFAALVDTLGRVKAELGRIGRDTEVGMAWSWIHELPPLPAGAGPWHFLTLGAQPPLDGRALRQYLAATSQSQVRRLVLVEPLPPSACPLEARLADFTEQIVAAKAGKAEGIFLPAPFDADRGVVQPDGSPGELFLPWRTLAWALGGAEFLGSIPLAQQSTNWLFARQQQAVLVLWNRRPVSEEVYLGDRAEVRDLWGRPVPTTTVAGGLAVPAGPVPLLVFGGPRGLAEWLVHFRLASDRLSSVFAQRQPNQIELQCPFEQGVEGSVELSGPEDWIILPRKTRFRLAPGEKFQQPLEIILPANASSGQHRIRADFDMFAGQKYRFTVWRTVTVGLDDVRLEVSTRLTPDGQLEIQQRVINDSDAPISLRCQLYAPERRRMSVQVVGLGRGEDVHVYHLPGGKELVGKTLWLQAEEVGGSRVLNYRFVAEQ